MRWQGHPGFRHADIDRLLFTLPPLVGAMRDPFPNHPPIIWCKPAGWGCCELVMSTDWITVGDPCEVDESGEKRPVVLIEAHDVNADWINYVRYPLPFGFGREHLRTALTEALAALGLVVASRAQEMAGQEGPPLSVA